jgi:hypothetical protein
MISDDVASVLSELAFEHDKAIAEHFGFDHALFDAPEIKHADNVMLATEARDLMGPVPAPWITLPTPCKWRVVPWTAEAAEAEFLRAYREITADDTHVAGDELCPGCHGRGGWYDEGQWTTCSCVVNAGA